MDGEIYGNYRDRMNMVLEGVERKLSAIRDEADGELIEHIISRIKDSESMREKCRKKGLPETPASALGEVTDAIGVRVVCQFIDDVYEVAGKIREWGDCSIFKEKDYIKHAKPNGYRSYHMILVLETDFEDVRGELPGHYFVEIQIRTIAMDSWASLEHQLRYKKDIKNADLIEAELKRCAGEMASTDVSMQTIRDLIKER